MARAIYSQELRDPDIAWLISRFQESHPEYVLVQSDSEEDQPLVFIVATSKKIDDRKQERKS